MTMNESESLDDANWTTILGRFWPGIALSAVVAGFFAFLGIAALGSTGYGALGIVYLAIIPGLPLLLALAGTWIHYMVRSRGGVPATVHVAMCLPVVLALMVIPMGMDKKQADQNRFHAAHPPVQEFHVNLSGKDLWLPVGSSALADSGSTPRMPMQAAGHHAIVSFTRYPDFPKIDLRSFPYEGTHLRQDISTYTYAPDGGDSGASARASVLPLVRFPYPDLRPLLPYESESGLLLYQYFHYQDHVEVVPSLSPFVGSTSDHLEGKVHGLVLFSIAVSRRPEPALVRLEINGQTLVLSPYAYAEAGMRCRMGYLKSSGALVDTDRPLHLRWQTLDEPLRWHEATVRVPAFVRVLPAGGHAGWPQVLLYFLGKDTVIAEHFEEVRFPGDKRALRDTGVPSEVPSDTFCGSAKDRYDPDHVALLPN